jgi:hypothetical protein
MKRQLIGRISTPDRFRLMKSFAQTQHRGSDWKTFRTVGIEQRIGPATETAGNLPTQIVGVLYTRVQPLSARRWMHMRRIPCQQHPPHPIPVNHADRRTIDRLPRNAAHPVSGGTVDSLFQIAANRVGFRDELKVRRLWQWA